MSLFAYFCFLLIRGSNSYLPPCVSKLFYYFPKHLSSVCTMVHQWNYFSYCVRLATPCYGVSNKFYLTKDWSWFASDLIVAPTPFNRRGWLKIGGLILKSCTMVVMSTCNRAFNVSANIITSDLNWYLPFVWFDVRIVA